MIKIIVACVMLALAIWAGVAIQASHGYVGLNFAGWSVEAPIWLAALALILTSILIFFIFKLLKILINLTAFLHRFRLERKRKQAKRYTVEGFFALFEGDWLKAEKALIEGAIGMDLPFMNYIFAAKAAGAQNHFEQAEQYLQMAEKSSAIYDKQAKFSYALKRGQLLCQQQKWSEALTLLVPLLDKNGRQVQLLKLIYQIYEHQKNWGQIIKLIPLLIKVHIFSEEMGGEYQKHAYGELMLVASSVSLENVKSLWKDMPKEYHIDTHLVCLYVNALLAYHLENEAEAILRHTLKHHWSEVLIKLYGKVKSSLPQKQLAFAENYLKSHPKSAMLLLTLGRICLYHQLWGKAQRYLEASITLAPQPDAFSELGKLLIKLNKPEEAAEYFKYGLFMLTSRSDADELLVHRPQ